MTTRPRWASRTRLTVIVTAGALASGLLLPAAASAGAAPAASGLGPPNTWVGTGQMSAARAGADGNAPAQRKGPHRRRRQVRR